MARQPEYPRAVTSIAPAEARAAIVTAPPKLKAATDRERTTRALAFLADTAAAMTIALCLLSVGWVSWHPIWSRPALSKITLRAEPLPTVEARR